jgi:hypothetical protein
MRCPGYYYLLPIFLLQFSRKPDVACGKALLVVELQLAPFRRFQAVQVRALGTGLDNKPVIYPSIAVRVVVWH